MKVMEGINFKIDILTKILYVIITIFIIKFFSPFAIFFYKRYNYDKIAPEVWYRRINEYKKANKKKVLIEDVHLIFLKK